MGTNAYPALNGVASSWADVNVSAGVDEGSLIEVPDIAAINHSGTVEIGKQRAPGGRVMKRTAGQADHDGSLTLYRDGHVRFLRALKAKAPLRGNQRRISLVVFDILIQHTPLGDTEIYTVKMKGCRIIGHSSDMSESTDADQIEVPLSVLEIAHIIDGEEVVLV